MAAATVDIQPSPGPQYAACASSADIVIYGGGAGGGKTWWLLAEPLRHVSNGGFKGAIFRRTYPQITGQGGIWDEARQMYPHFGARMREGSDLDARFPSGASIAFCHMQHEKTKYEYQGHQICYLGFDELTHFSESQFFYMLSRNRSTCGVLPYCRATCNPDGSSWVADFIAWWIDPESGMAIADRCGVLRYFVRTDIGDGEKIYWADTKDELRQQFPEFEANDILSVTFIAASVTDNPYLDKTYVGKLKALPKIERDRLLGCNWKTREGAIIDEAWLNTYWVVDGHLRFSFQGYVYEIPLSGCRRFATIDTAGTSKEKAAAQRGDPPSWSVCGIWDWIPSMVLTPNNTRTVLTQMLFLRHVWRQRVDWNQLKLDIPTVLATWNVEKAYIENAHHGQPLRSEIRCCSTEMVGPVIAGMGDGSDGAKLERAIASGLLTLLELGKVFLPADNPPWLAAYKRELTVWTGLPKETADQIDISSYAAYVSRSQKDSWGGTIPHNIRQGQR
jgi:hypothetical protein